MIQVIGGGGLLGRFVRKVIRKRGMQVVSEYLDITTIKSEHIQAPYVINCAVVLQRNTVEEVMTEVNTEGPKLLARACDEVGSRLLHVSTDGVFFRNGPHDEDSPTSPQSMYAATKLAGEIVRPPHCTVRTSFIGPSPRNVMFDVLCSDKELKASSKWQWSGNTVLTVANLLVDIVLRKDVVGLLHIPGEFKTRLQLIQDLVEWLGADPVRIVQDDSFIDDRRLVSKRWKDLGLPEIPPFKDQLRQMEKPRCET